MTLEIMTEATPAGDIKMGKVTGITSFGAFVRLEDGQEGLVHISEIADAYVKAISDFIELNQDVKVKVLGTNKKGKLDLSIKRVPGYSLTPKTPEAAMAMQNSRGKKRDRDRPVPNSFEDKISQFLKRSEEKQLDVRRNLQAHQGIKKKKKLKE